MINGIFKQREKYYPPETITPQVKKYTRYSADVHTTAPTRALYQAKRGKIIDVVVNDQASLNRYREMAKSCQKVSDNAITRLTDDVIDSILSLSKKAL